MYGVTSPPASLPRQPLQERALKKQYPHRGSVSNETRRLGASFRVHASDSKLLLANLDYY